MCLFYLLQIVMCTMPFIQYTSSEGEFTSASPFYMITILFGVVSGLTNEAILACVLCIFLVVIPTVGFFFCALDKERNVKNIVSILCCIAGVYLVLAVSKDAISLGAVIALLLYILIMILTSMAMVMRLSKEDEEKDKKELK